MKPQTAEILGHLKRHGSITPQVALREYRTMRLAARVLELRQDGYPIQTVLQYRAGRGRAVRFAEYRMGNRNG